MSKSKNLNVPEWSVCPCPLSDTSGAASSTPANKEGRGDGATLSKQQKLEFSALQYQSLSLPE